MSTWDELHPIEFDSTLGTAAQRRFVREAPNTLFPRLLPDVEPKPGKHAKPELQSDGQGALFAGEAQEDEEAWLWR